jgi:hypothetical protein
MLMNVIRGKAVHASAQVCFMSSPAIVCAHKSFKLFGEGAMSGRKQPLKMRQLSRGGCSGYRFAGDTHFWVDAVIMLRIYCLEATRRRALPTSKQVSGIVGLAQAAALASLPLRWNERRHKTAVPAVEIAYPALRAPTKTNRAIVRSRSERRNDTDDQYPCTPQWTFGGQSIMFIEDV